jgi:cytochrome c oxidase subunit 2
VWQFKYPGEQNVFTFTDLYVPVGMTITMDITSVDVQHSWWIPALAGKADALPGYTNKSWFKVDRPGIWRGQCAELCGRNHANMYARVIALPFDEWKAWYARTVVALKAARDAAAKGRAELDKAQGAAAASGSTTSGSESP